MLLMFSFTNSSEQYFQSLCGERENIYYENPCVTELLKSRDGYDLRTMLVILKNNAINTYEAHKIKQAILNLLWDHNRQCNNLYNNELFLNYVKYLLFINQTILTCLEQNTNEHKTTGAFIAHLKDIMQRFS